MDIKFSHHYPKLHGQTLAQLITVKVFDRSELCDDFIEYDTFWISNEGKGPETTMTGHYPLPPARYLILIFLGNKNIPFTTVRPWTSEKLRWYTSNIGNTFNIVHVEKRYNMDPTDKFSICKLMDELEQMETFISQNEYIQFTERKRLARICRESINKFALILDFIRGFLPNFMINKELKK